MKALAAVNIRQLENAVGSLVAYRQTVEMGLQALLRTNDQLRINARIAPYAATAMIVFGSDQGMCGPLNDIVARFTMRQPEMNILSESQLQFIAVGARVATRLRDAGQNVSTVLPVANSTAGIIPLVQELLMLVEQCQRRSGINRIIIIFSEHTSRASFETQRLDLLPLDRKWLLVMRQKEWPTNRIPIFAMDPNTLFTSLIRQYLFISLYRACAESMASENASRLAAMRGAERNIGDRLERLTQEFHQTRQMTITEELLDIASGFEAIRGAD